MAQMNHNAEAKEIIEPIIGLAVKHGYKKKLYQIYTIMGTYYFLVEDNFPEAFKNLEEALKTSEEVKDILTQVLASQWYGMASSQNREFEKGAIYIQRAHDINLAAKNIWGTAVMKSTLAYCCYYLHGKINQQFSTTADGLRIAEESGDTLSKSIASANHGISCYAKGLFEESEKYSLKGLEFSEKIGIPTWIGLAHFNLGETYFETGNFLRSMEHYEKSCLVLERNRLMPSVVGLGNVGLARSKVMNKEKDVNLESLYVHSRNNKVKAAEGWNQRYIGEILLNIDDQHLSESEHWIQKAIEADQRNGTMFDLGKDYALYAELFKQRGDKLKAQENLGKAIEIFKECGADGWFEKAEKELAMIT
jgi:tetratricopeptide (TPR) repeat protein